MDAFATVARRKGADWYVGSICGWQGHETEIDTSFLGEGMWKAEIFADGINADRDALFLTGTGAADAKGQYLVGAGGAVVSTAEAPNGVGVLNVVLKHDPALGDAPDGGLVKKGPGVLAISPESTFTGPIIAEGRVYVDFGRTAENPIRVGEVYPIAIVDGTVRGPTGGAIRFRPLNAPGESRWSR